MDTKRTYMMKLQKELILSGQFPSCISCESFNKHTEHCEYMNANAKPPAVIIATGCEVYVNDIRF